MLVPYKDRHLRRYDKIQVYRNVSKKDGIWYSIKQSGRVVAHVNELSIKDAKFHVNQRGRERTKKTGQKNVHAWIEGYLTNYAYARIGRQMTRIIYDPKLYKNFVTWKEHKKVTNAKTVVLYSGGVLACLPERKKRGR